MLIYQPHRAELSAKLKHFFQSAKFSGRKIENKTASVFQIQEKKRFKLVVVQQLM